MQKLTIQNYKKTKAVNRKGRYAATSERRRVVWKDFLRPLIKDCEKSYFTLEEFRINRDEVCKNKNFIPKEINGGFISLLHKGIINSYNNGILNFYTGC